MAAIFDSWTAKFYHSEALQSGHAASEIWEPWVQLFPKIFIWMDLTLLHSERPKLYGGLTILSAIGLNARAVINCAR